MSPVPEDAFILYLGELHGTHFAIHFCEHINDRNTLRYYGDCETSLIDHKIIAKGSNLILYSWGAHEITIVVPKREKRRCVMSGEVLSNLTHKVLCRKVAPWGLVLTLKYDKKSVTARALNVNLDSNRFRHLCRVFDDAMKSAAYSVGTCDVLPNRSSISL
jgi:hypothetical protein